MINKTRFALFAVLLSVLLLLCGCGDDEGGDITPVTDPSSAIGTGPAESVGTSGEEEPGTDITAGQPEDGSALPGEDDTETEQGTPAGEAAEIDTPSTDAPSTDTPSTDTPSTDATSGEQPDVPSDGEAGKQDGEDSSEPSPGDTQSTGDGKVQSGEDDVPSSGDGKTPDSSELQPGTTEPGVTEPEVTEPEVTEPEVTEPEVTEPEVTEPVITEPEITEPEIIEPTGISLDRKPSDMTVGDTITLTATVSPADASDNTVSWSTSDKTVATVKKGKVTALSAGKAVIYARTSNGIVASVEITVLAAEVQVTGVTTDVNTLSLYKGDSYKLTAKAVPSDAGNKTLTYTSSDASVAAVDANGNITAAGKGNAVITVTTHNGFRANVTVTVSERTPMNPVEYEYYYSMLTDEDEKNIYRVLEEAFSQTVSTVTDSDFLLSVTLDPEKLKTVFNYLMLDHPEFFHALPEYSGSYLGSVVSSLTLSYRMSAGEYASALTALDKLIAPLLEKAAALPGSYERALAAYEFVKEKLSYDYSFSPQSYYMYDALSSGKGVCEAYSGLFSYLLRKMGIKSLQVEGTGEGGGHQWTMAEIDGKWYHFDPTWDDPATSGSNDFVYLNYFAVTDSDILSDHTVNTPALLPKAASSDANWFTRNGLVLTSLDSEPVASVSARSSALTGHIIFKASRDVYDAIATNSKLIWSFVNSVADSASGVTYMLNDSSLSVEIFYTE